jgi:hypothetical protein
MLVLTLTDASDGGFIASPSFSEMTSSGTTPATAESRCATADAGCAVYDFRLLPEGMHTLTISAPGYSSATVTFSISGPTGCCGQGPEVDKTVALSHP